MTPRLHAEALRCVRDGRLLFDNLHFTLAPGQALQVEGYNGAGKTTLLRLLCGLTPLQHGEIYWDQQPIRRCREDYQQQLLYFGHQLGLKDELTALENLHFTQALRGSPIGSHRLESALERVGLYGFEDVPVRTLSAGQRRRVALARLWLSPPLLWILDEPFTAIDRNGVLELEQVMHTHLQQGGMLLLTSHQSVKLPGLGRLVLQ